MRAPGDVGTTCSVRDEGDPVVVKRSWLLGVSAGGVVIQPE